ncbi:MSHA pilin protein MshA [Vibrio hyugaensis]|uniref:MSHA pilin protein MshA n=1 Tax=Vibrio hyugaensis TaxID=1534743 RepID=A0ABQ5Y1R5_9VIBR|nr:MULTISPECIES: type II secretion system protein [Vibrio]KIP71966.1 MSHA biogenesis protein MshA [Vibrio harveyi]PAW10960.1 MSHA biogenesis protein MshA [Vibrio sp. V1B]GLR04942.1 MSHA pilin protein MshA [Vibrio hyugaensis]
MKRKSGFTLIELVVVIVILGILAVTAAPRFLNIQDDAREARLEGMKGAIASGLGIGFGKMAVAGLEHYRYVSNIGPDTGITPNTPAMDLPFPGCEVNGSNSCTFRYGYADADESSLSILVAELDDRHGESDWRVESDEDEITAYIYARDDGKSDATQCAIKYTPPVNQSGEYTLEILPCSK